MDWVNNKLYFTDETLNIIGTFNPSNFNYTVLIRTGPNTRPRAIVLDPNARYTMPLLGFLAFVKMLLMCS